MNKPGARPYWEISDTVEQLKRENKLDEAMAMVMESVEYAEVHIADGKSLYTTPYDRAATILKKQKRPADVVGLYERYLTHCLLTDFERGAERLLKACQAAGQIELRPVDGGDPVPYHIPDDRPFFERDVFTRRGLVVDVETTGLSREDELIELGAILFRFNAHKGRVVGIERTYTGRREPRVPITAEARKVHGISAKDLRGCCLDDACVREMFGQAHIVIAHNASFDRRFVAHLYPEFEQADWYCTMNGLAWHDKGIASKSLASVAAATGVTAQRAHAGLGDAQTVFEILKSSDSATGKPYLSELLCGEPARATAPRRESSGAMTITVDVGRFASPAEPQPEPARKRGLLDRLLGR